MPASARVLDVVTINLWGDHGPAAARLEALACWLGDERPDVVLLQEVERIDGRGQADVLAAAAGYPHVDRVRTGRALRGGEGLAVLARHPLTPVPMTALPSPLLDHPRGLQQVDVAVAGGPIRVGNTHLSWPLRAGAVRAAQVRAILAALPLGRRPIVLGGDLNDEPASPPLRTLARAGFADCCVRGVGEAVTFDTANAYLWQEELAGRRVDHVLAHGLGLVRAGVVLDGTAGPVVSDHYGVRVTLRRSAA